MTAVVATRAESIGSRRALVLALAMGVALIGWIYRDTFGTIVRRWHEDAAFSHGYLIVPISLWLAWQKREALAQARWSPSWLGIVAMLGAVVAWIVARGSGVLVVEQAAAVAMIPALVLALLGRDAATVVVFPLAFLFFAVPFGRALVPFFMQVTADVATLALRLTGVPVFRSHMYISIPGGNFEVARACSGLNYAITGLVLGVLYAHATYTKWPKRVLCVLAFLLIPILANGIRVFLTILISHLTDMRFGPGAEHVVLGRILFITIILLVFWVGRRWKDDEPAVVTARPTTQPQVSVQGWLVAALAVAPALIGPPFLASSLAVARSDLADVSNLVALPAGRAGWQGPLPDVSGWRPLFVGALTERAGVYRDASGATVDIYVGVYGPGKALGSEMISYQNRIFPTEHESVAAEVKRPLALPDGSRFEVMQQGVRDASGQHLVWYWYMVGRRHFTSEFAVKAGEAWSFATGRIRPERIVTLSTSLDAGAEARLAAFAAAHPGCIASGLDEMTCRH